MSQLDEEAIKRAVRQHYAQRASTTVTACCGPGECCDEMSSSVSGDVPPEALSLSAGCASPVSHTEVHEGETVLDLGSGGGIDVFRVSKLVGPKGRVIGVDATPEMVWKARQTAEKYGYGNVEFRLGELEHLPVESDTVDLVMSNCVINLVPDKELAFRESFRVLKPGGRAVVADVVALQPMPDQLKTNLEAWSRCISGALEEEQYLATLTRAGFGQVKILQRTPRTAGFSTSLVRLADDIISASKP